MGSREFIVTYDESEFHREKELVDWGVLLSEGRSTDVYVCVVALTPAEAADMLRKAAEAVDAKSATE